MQGIIVFILVFFVVVTVHELGHLIAAKKSGILCQEFAIGFGPKIFSKKIGETNYTIRLLPLGGYVKMPDNVFDFNNEISPYDIKKGMQLYLKLNDNNKVEKIILDRSNDTHLVQIEVDEYDLTENLFIQGFTNNGQELEKFSVEKNACVVFSGMEEQIASLDRMFSSHSWKKQFVTLFAGPFMNFILALFIFIGISIYSGVPVKESVVGKVVENMPAQQAGLKEDDKILSVNGNSTATYVEVVENVVNSNGQQLVLKVERNGSEETINITPQVKTVTNSKGEEQKVYQIGIYQKTKIDVVESISVGTQNTLYYGTAIFKGIVGLFASAFNGSFSLDNLGGPVAIYELSNEAAKDGLLQIFKWIGLLSVNLGLMNLIPIPVLDGGRIVFVMYEGIFGKPISKKAQYYLTAIFSILLVILMLAVTWNDISRLFGK